MFITTLLTDGVVRIRIRGRGCDVMLGQASVRRRRASVLVTDLRRNVRATTVQSVWKMVPLRRRFVKLRKAAVVAQVSVPSAGIASCGWLWMAVDGCGWLWMAVDSCVRVCSRMSGIGPVSFGARESLC